MINENHHVVEVLFGALPHATLSTGGTHGTLNNKPFVGLAVQRIAEHITDLKTGGKIGKDRKVDLVGPRYHFVFCKLENLDMMIGQLKDMRKLMVKKLKETQCSSTKKASSSASSQKSKSTKSRTRTRSSTR